MNAFIEFLPSTFSYPDMSGESSDPTVSDKNDEEEPQVKKATQGTLTEDALAKIGKFAQQMANAAEDKVNDEDEVEDEDKVEDDDMPENSSLNEDVQSSSEDTPLLLSIDNADLWIKFMSLLTADSVEDILYFVSEAGMFRSLLSFVNAKSLVLSCL